MSFGDRELSDTNQTVHFTGRFISEQGRSFRQTHRQITIGTLFIQIYLILEGAGHRTQGETFLCFIMRITHDKHTIEIVIPVTGNFIQFSLGKQRRLGELTAFGLLHILNPALQKLYHSGTLRQ